MDKHSFLDELLKRYEANFDIERNFTLKDSTYPAYAYFHSFSEKYVLKKEAQLWAVKAYEHVFFLDKELVTDEVLSMINRIITEDAEPLLVRKNEKYPEKDHMCSYITFIILSDKTPDKEVQKAIKKFSYDKGYLFNFRGHSEARIATLSMEDGSIFTNKNGKDLADLLKDIYEKMAA